MIAHLESRIDSLRYEILLARKVTDSMDAENKALQKDVGLLKQVVGKAPTELVARVNEMEQELAHADM